jgi:hypothetical protein
MYFHINIWLILDMIALTVNLEQDFTYKLYMHVVIL